MSRRPSALRSLSLLAATALVLHELRYALAPASHGAGHDYLGWLAAPVAGVAALAAGAFVLALARAREGIGFARERAGFAGGGRPPARPPRPLAASWLAASAALATTFGVQELLEALLVSGEAAGAAGAFANGGWAGFLLAPPLGWLVAVLSRGADAVLSRAAQGAPTRRPAPLIAPRPRPALRQALDPLARNLAGRGPPVTG